MIIQQGHQRDMKGQKETQIDKAIDYRSLDQELLLDRRNTNQREVRGTISEQM